MNEPKTELGRYLLRIQIKNNLSKREFASKLHCSSDTITRMIDGGEPPTIKFLRSVSSYTGTGLLTLLRMSFPDEIPQPSAKSMALAEKIDRIPEPRRTWIIELIENADTGSSNTGGDEGEIGV